MTYKCLKDFPEDSAWQAYKDGARHEELLEYAIRQHQQKLRAEQVSDCYSRALERLATIAREALSWESHK